ncbi:MAG TPA: T9SS type A sorting domain-containing protein, partial [Bacteroidia bacterium]|nr:T9SS type A sorting domain-containing protein [Bacteroidia bacterium]
TVSNPGFTPLVSPNNISDFGCACGDEIVSSPINIGFTFMFDGVAYTQFEVSDNGQLFLGAPAYSCSSNCGPTCSFSEMEPANLSGGTDRNVICPLWDDLGFNNCTASVNYLMSGAVGNRTMTVEWLLVDWKSNNSGNPHGSISFQVVLYEAAAGQIDFIYRQDAQQLGSGTQAPHARIGLMGAAGDFYSTDETGTTLSNVSEYTVTAKPATGIQFRWTEATTTSINHFTSNNSINVYPNPVTDYVSINVKSSNEIKSIEVYNEIGTKVYDNGGVNNKPLQKIDMRTLPAGIYFIKLNTNAAPIRKRVIKS